MGATTRRRHLVVASVAALTMLVAACGSDDDGGVASDAESPGEVEDSADDGEVGEITLVVQTFGDFGYETAIEAFEAENPHITVDWQQMGELRDFAPQLAQWIAAGSGAGDVVGLDEGIALQYIENPDGMLDLFEVGGEELEGVYLDWKWERGITEDGRLIGLGTDVGGLAMCYRADLFEEAGLPTDRDEVSALWDDWDDYLDVGREFRDSGADAAWLDSATGVIQPYVMQNSDVFFYNTDGEFIGEENPVFQEAWDYAMQMNDEDLTARLILWSDDWTAGYQNSDFATRPCPSWMTGLIEDWSGQEHAGLWDIADIPGGGGNWGGSYLAVPAQTEHPQEAYELAKFLTSPEGHVLVFEQTGGLPSSLDGLADPRVTESTNPYFNDAPVGQIMAATVEGLEPAHLGALHQDTWENIFEPAIQRVEAGDQTPDEAFAQAVQEAEALQ